jgi:hypothetical protein
MTTLTFKVKIPVKHLTAEAVSEARRALVQRLKIKRSWVVDTSVDVESDESNGDD